MTDNAINDRYSIPLLKQVVFRIQNREPKVHLYPDGGFPIITENSVTLHGDSNDYVYSDESYSAHSRGLVFECNLPVIQEGDNAAVYFGTYNYGGEIYYDGGYKIYYWSDCGDNSNEFSYNENDLFRIYIDSQNVYFSINGVVANVFSYSCSGNQAVAIGFDGSGSSNNTYTLSNILYYQTGKIGQDGVNGSIGNSLLSGSGNPLPTLGNNGDAYNDILTNTFWANNGSWQPFSPPTIPGNVVSLAAGSHTVDIWNFVGTPYNSVLITIAFAQDSTARVPVNLVQVMINIANSAAIPRWNSVGAFPSGITISTVYSPNPNPTFNGARISGTGTTVAYNYITYKIQILN
jgi:hypothetical protein